MLVNPEPDELEPNRATNLPASTVLSGTGDDVVSGCALVKAYTLNGFHVVQRARCALTIALCEIRLISGFLTFSRNKRNQPFLVSEALPLDGRLAYIHQQAVDLQHPHHGIVGKPARQRPFR